MGGAADGTPRDTCPAPSILALSLLVNLGLLFAFKYLGFFSESLEALLGLLGQPTDVPSIALVLPVGISFYTFQTLSYSIDVYRGEKEPERHLGVFALYVSFFPQLVAGPIERSTRLLPQFFQERDFDYDRVVDGLKLMLWGFFKKVVIADRVGLYVDEVYNNPDGYEGLPIWVATYLFAVQIYCDFSGYSDIAIGAAKVLGFDLMENFRRPYFSKSVQEFWRRWHISLSTWFRDYVYVALGGNRVSTGWWYFNIMVVFVVSGLWHGAAWTFVIWGALHGAFLSVGTITEPIRKKVWNRLEKATQTRLSFHAAGFHAWPLAYMRQWVAVLVTFHLVCFGWVFFRANSLPDVILLLQQAILFSDFQVALPAFGVRELIISFISIFILLGVQIIERREDVRSFLSGRPTWLRWSVYLSVILMIACYRQFEARDFIYFQF